MAAALRSRYGVGADGTKFFDLFAAEPADFEKQALSVVDGGLARGVEPRLVKRAARLLQSYEKLYWDTLHRCHGDELARERRRPRRPPKAERLLARSRRPRPRSFHESRRDRR